MSTATIAFVFGVTAARTASGSRLSVRGSTSANTGTPPSYMKQLALAANEYGDVITSSPAPIPAEMQSRCSPAVPEETAAAYGTPTHSASASSKRSIIGPSDNRPERSTSRTSSSSRSSRNAPDSGTGRASCFTSRLLRGRRVLEPVAPAVATALARVEVRLLDLARDRSRPADDVVVDLTDRRHLGGRADHEHLVGEVQVGADQVLLDHRVAEVLCDLHDRVARDPGEDRRREIGRVQHAVADQEQALAGAVGEIALRGQQDRLVVAGAVRLPDREHRVEVHARRLRDVRDHVRTDTLPARDLDADAVLE